MNAFCTTKTTHPSDNNFILFLLSGSFNCVRRENQTKRHTNQKSQTNRCETDFVLGFISNLVIVTSLLFAKFLLLCNTYQPGKIEAN